jgi:hypothetical protein
MQAPQLNLFEYNSTYKNYLLGSLKSAVLYGVDANIILENMLAVGEVKLLVDDSEEPVVIYGCVAYTSSTLLWIYIKEAFRQTRLSNYMLPSGLKYYWLKGTNKTWQQWTKNRHLKWNPYSILM